MSNTYLIKYVQLEDYVKPMQPFLLTWIVMAALTVLSNCCNALHEGPMFSNAL